MASWTLICSDFYVRVNNRGLCRHQQASLWILVIARHFICCLCVRGGVNETMMIEIPENVNIGCSGECLVNIMLRAIYH